MKYLKLLTLILLTSFTLTSCLKDPGTPSLSASKAAVAVDEEVTITLSGAENYTCILWEFTDDKHTIVSGGEQNDMSMNVKFSEAGTYEITVAVKNCKGGDDDCTGTCKDEYATQTITVQ